MDLLQDTEKCYIKLRMKNIQPLTTGLANKGVSGMRKFAPASMVRVIRREINRNGKALMERSGIIPCRLYCQTLCGILK